LASPQLTTWQLVDSELQLPELMHFAV